jgi:hypothetical protein
VAVLKESFTVKSWPGDDGVELTVRTVLRGVEVTVWTRIALPSLVAYVRSWFQGEAEQASLSDRSPPTANWPRSTVNGR